MNETPGRIIVADAQEAELTTIVKALEDDGYAFVLASDGEEALRLAADQPPDLVILDAAIPKLDGFAVARALRERPETKKTAIIMVGEVQSTEVAARSFESGADDFIPKPLVPAHLRARVQTWLLRSQSRK